MTRDSAVVSGLKVTIYSLNTVVVGSGAAGLNAADRLHAFGQRDIALVTERMTGGTSRNAGSDKQTYYKLTLAGGAGDSPREMAETLFGGGCMHGDIALVEAAMSAECFYRLVEIGVPFPHNRYGEYVGYKTDHDPRRRATSAGPLTSRLMTERLEECVRRRGITIFDGFQVIGILTDGEKRRSVGLVALNLNALGNPDERYTVFNCTNVVFATGGPAGMYGASVYPESQTGSTGIAFEAGVKGMNLTESQFGIASVGFRWNLSGTYQQVLPRYVSTDGDGGDEREFLLDYFESAGKMLDAVFLKGYQWPFDPLRVAGPGSSLIDLLVYEETVLKGRKVYLDYTRNPSGAGRDGELDGAVLGEEARKYLEKSGALCGRPVDRLIRMNRPAYELFRSHGIDLKKEYLEIAVCAQHNNGGLYGNIWWESNLRHFFPVGEVNGGHGVRRPGGSALNAGQVGGTRAAMYIASRYGGAPPGTDVFLGLCREQLERKIGLAERLVSTVGGGSTVSSVRRAIGKRMDSCGALIRSRDSARAGMEEAKRALEDFAGETRLSSVEELPDALKNYDLLLAQYVYLYAILSYIEDSGGSRGSYIVHDPGGDLPAEGLPEIFRFSPDRGAHSDRIQVVSYEDGVCTCEWERVRPIPEGEDWFENVWNEYSRGGIIRRRYSDGTGGVRGVGSA